jgi:hypothetical protein
VVLRLAAAGHDGHLLGQVGDGDGLVAVRAGATGADAAGEGGAVGAALLAEETLPAVRAFVDGVLAARPGGRDDNGGVVLVAAPERGLAAPVTAVSLPATPAPPLAALRPRWLRAARYAKEAVLPFYLLHEPVIVAAAWLIVRWPAPVPAKYAVLVIVSFAATLGLYEALGPAVPRHPAPIRHEAPHQARDPAPGSASDRRG